MYPCIHRKNLSDSNVQEDIQEKVQDENSSESVENTNVLECHAPSLETSRLNINYNNSNGENFTFSLLDEIKKLYRGIKGRRYAEYFGRTGDCKQYGKYGTY